MKQLPGGGGATPAGPRRSTAVFLAIWLGVAGSVAAQPTARPSSGGASDPITSEIEVNRGIVDFEQGRYGDALRRLEQGGPAAGGAGTAYYRGLALLALKRAREALNEFAAVSRQPGAPAEVALDMAVAQIATGQAEAAEATLRDYVRDHPEDPYGHYFLGVALFRLRRYHEALTELEMASSDAKLAPYLDFYRGLSAFAHGEGNYQQLLQRYGGGAPAGAASDLTRQLLASPGRPGFQPGQAPPTGATRAAVGGPRGAAGIPGPDPDRRWNLAILTGYEYDTNVALVPNLILNPLINAGAGRPATAGPQDSRWTLASFGDYRLVQNDQWVLGLIGSTYDTWQFDLTDFNFQDYMGGVYSNYALGQLLIAGIRYEFHESLLGGEHFATDHRLVPNLTLREGSVGHLTTFYEFESLNINNLDLGLPRQLSRSSNINSVGVTQAFYLFQDVGRLFVNYRHDWIDAYGSDFDARVNQVEGRLEFPLPFKAVGFGGARYYWFDYRNPNSLDFFNRPRYDNRVEARAGLQKYFTRNLSLLLEYVYTMNDSNVENLFGVSPYTYNRNIFSSLLIFDF